jgi:hypothetical protein
MNRIPPRHTGPNGSRSPKNEGFVYLAKIGKNMRFCPNRNNVYKIGLTKNVKGRMNGLCLRENVPIELVACGFTGNMLKTERLLHEQYEGARYRFVYEEEFPRWSVEFFQFGQYHIIKIIESMNILCKDLIVFEDPRPRWNTGNAHWIYNEWTEERVNVEPEFI